MTNSISQRKATSDGRRPGGCGNAMSSRSRRQIEIGSSREREVAEMVACLSIVDQLLSDEYGRQCALHRVGGVIWSRETDTRE